MSEEKRVPCRCVCHTQGEDAVKHIVPCCDNGYVYENIHDDSLSAVDPGDVAELMVAVKEVAVQHTALLKRFEQELVGVGFLPREVRPFTLAFSGQLLKEENTISEAELKIIALTVRTVYEAYHENGFSAEEMLQVMNAYNLEEIRKNVSEHNEESHPRFPQDPGI